MSLLLTPGPKPSLKELEWGAVGENVPGANDEVVAIVILEVEERARWSVGLVQGLSRLEERLTRQRYCWI